MEMISVIVPVYNVEKYLKRCVDSIKNQTYDNIEIILVDDGSKDSSGKICDDLSKSDNRIVVIHKKNGGLSSARNAGLKKASGKYVAFVDSDDFIEKDMYKNLYSLISKSEYKIASCGFKYVYDNGKIEKKLETNDVKKFDFYDSIKEMNIYRYFDMSVCTKLFRKEIFEDIEFPVGKLSEDFFIMYKLIEKSNGLIYINKYMYNYFQRVNSITKSTTINSDFERAAYEQMVYIENKYPNLKPVVRSAYASANLTVFNFYIKNGVKCPKNVKMTIRKNVIDNFKYVKKSKMYGKVKYLQFLIFIYASPFYKLMFNIYRKNVK